MRSYGAIHCWRSLGHMLERPAYLGVQSFTECLFYEPVNSAHVDKISLYEATRHPEYEVNLYKRNGVRTVSRAADGKVRLDSLERTAIYDAVILTPPTWALEMSINFEGFKPDAVPFSVRDSVAMSHWITSCKVFFPLTRRYWEERRGDGEPIIPQLLVTDTFIQGVYGAMQ